MSQGSIFERYFSSRMGYLMAILAIVLCGGVALEYVTLTSFPYSRSTNILVSAQFFDKTDKYIANHVASHIEEVFSSQDGLEYTKLVIGDNSLRFTGKFDKSIDIDAVTRDISNQLANRPMVQENLNELEVGLDEGDYAPDLGFVLTSESLPDTVVSRLITSEVYPLLRSLSGVKKVEVFGPSEAIYIDINQDRLNAAGIALNQVYDSVKNAFSQPAGFVIDAKQYETYQHRETTNGIQKIASIRMQDEKGQSHSLTEIASFRTDNEYTRIKARFNNKDGVVLLASFDGRSNPISVAEQIQETIREFAQQEPDITAIEVINSTTLLYDSIKETLLSIVLSISVTCLVVFFTTRSLVSAMAISVSIPLSLLLAFTFFSVTLESINLITITALIIAIGLVVDDSIVVTDYLNSHHQSHLSPYGRLRTILKVLVAITLTLVVVYMPYVFSKADYSVVSKEFGLAISIALLCSLLVSIFITPKLIPNSASHLAKKSNTEYQNPFLRMYSASLQPVCQYGSVRALIALLIFGYLAYGVHAWQVTESEVVPPEDKRLLLVLSEVNPVSTSKELIDQADRLTQQILALDWVDSTNYVTGAPSKNMITHYIRLKPNADDETKQINLIERTQRIWQQLLDNPQRNNDLVQRSRELNALLGQEVLSRSFVILPADVPGASNFPIDIAVLGSDIETLQKVVEESLAQARASGQYEFLIHDAKYASNHFLIETLLDKSAYSNADHRYMASLMAAFEQPNFVGKMPHANENVKVYLGLQASATPALESSKIIQDYILYNDSGRKLMKSSLYRVAPSFEPQNINKTNGVPSIAIRGTTLAGIDKYKAITDLRDNLIHNGIPEQNVVLMGTSRSIVYSASEHLMITLLSLALIYLLLTLLFDSLLVPLIIVLSTIPVTYFSGYIALQLFGLSDNIYTRLSILTAIGLSSKQAVIMVFEVLGQIARQQQLDGRHIRAAIVSGCEKRFNAVFMTSFSLILGVLPLILQFSYGAVAKYNIAIVIVFCMTLSFLTVLYLVPMLMMCVPSSLYRRLTQAPATSSRLSEQPETAC